MPDPHVTPEPVESRGATRPLDRAARVTTGQGTPATRSPHPHRPWLQIGPVQIIFPHMTRWVTVTPRITIGRVR